MATETQQSAGETDRTDQSAEAQSAEQTGSDGAQERSDLIQRAIAQALEPALSEIQERAEQAVEERAQQGEAPQSAPSEERASSRQRRTKTSSDQQNQGSTNMTAEANQTSQQETDEQQNTQERQPEQQAAPQPQSNTNPPAPRTESSPEPRQSEVGRASSPSQVVRVGRLHMAREWRDQGSVHEAIHAYEEIVATYPGTGVAAAAIEDLTKMAQNLEAEGQFHAALDLYHRLEQLGVDR